MMSGRILQGRFSVESRFRMVAAEVFHLHASSRTKRSAKTPGRIGPRVKQMREWFHVAYRDGHLNSVCLPPTQLAHRSSSHRLLSLVRPLSAFPTLDTRRTIVSCVGFVLPWKSFFCTLNGRAQPGSACASPVDA